MLLQASEARVKRYSSDKIPLVLFGSEEAPVVTSENSAALTSSSFMYPPTAAPQGLLVCRFAEELSPSEAP